MRRYSFDTPVFWSLAMLLFLSSGIMLIMSTIEDRDCAITSSEYEALKLVSPLQIAISRQEAATAAPRESISLPPEDDEVAWLRNQVADLVKQNERLTWEFGNVQPDQSGIELYTLIQLRRHLETLRTEVQPDNRDAHRTITRLTALLTAELIGQGIDSPITEQLAVIEYEKEMRQIGDGRRESEIDEPN